MTMLDARNIIVREELTLVPHGGAGFRVVRRGGTPVCDDGPETLARAAKFAIEAGPLNGKSVAWIGGGLCVGPRVFAVADCKQTVFEIEGALNDFCPDGVDFYHGDWKESFFGRYDIIVFDVEDPPYDALREHLNPGGKILPLENRHG